MNQPQIDQGFEPTGYRRWREQVERGLHGEDFERRLVSRTYDGLRIAPLYPPGNGDCQPWRGVAGRWRVAQRVDHPDPAAARDLALTDLEGGADALTIVASTSAFARGYGLPIRNLDDLDNVLSDVLLDGIGVRLDAGEGGIDLAMLLVALAERRGHPPGAVAFDLGIDLIGAGLTSGCLRRLGPELPALVADFRERGFGRRILLCDGRPHHEAGASEAQELAAVLGTGLAYLRTLEEAGHDLSAARDALSFLLVADADQFLTIAKFRALRRLWTRIEDLCGLARVPIHLHAETSWRMKTRRDPWVNMLRETVATFSAGIGGADVITGLPFTSALGLPDAFARRVVRNVQLILLDEVHLWRVADPAAGSGGIEALTDALCGKAWDLFRTNEGDGGFVESVASGAWQRLLAATRQERERAAATLADPITGTSSFPDLSEKPVAVLMPNPNADAHDRERTGPDQPLTIEPLSPWRGAAAFERLRDRGDAVWRANGTRPAIFIACLGPRTVFAARAAFAKNLFEAGGVEALEQTVTSMDDLAQAFRASGASAACLCSSDEIFDAPLQDAVQKGGTGLEVMARAIRRAGCARLYVVGNPERPEIKSSEADSINLVYPGCDVVKVLESFFASA